jgi:hypothetical protein
MPLKKDISSVTPFTDSSHTEQNGHSEQETEANGYGSEADPLDMCIVGAGFAGVYLLHHRGRPYYPHDPDFLDVVDLPETRPAQTSAEYGTGIDIRGQEWTVNIPSMLCPYLKSTAIGHGLPTIPTMQNCANTFSTSKIVSTSRKTASSTAKLLPQNGTTRRACGRSSARLAGHSKPNFGRRALGLPRNDIFRTGKAWRTSKE